MDPFPENTIADAGKEEADREAIKEAVAKLVRQVDIMCDRSTIAGRNGKVPANITVSEADSGTRIEIRLRGDHQPERVEALHAMLHLVLSSRYLERGLSKQCPEGTNGRSRQSLVAMTVPTNVVQDVAQHVHDLAHKVETTPALQEQYRKAARLVEEHIHHPKVPGVYTMIYPKFSEGIPETPVFKLVICGMPDRWADQLAGILGNGCIIEKISGRRPVAGQICWGGKTMMMNMDHPRIDEACAKLEDLAGKEPQAGMAQRVKRGRPRKASPSFP